MSTYYTRATALVSLGLLTVLSAGCHRNSDAAPPAAVPAGAPVVTTAVPKRQSLTVTVEQPGRVEAFEQTPIFAKIAGYIRDVKVEVGSRVKKGDLLAELDVPEMVEDLHHRQGQVTQAELDIRQSETSVRVAVANVATADALVHEAQAGQKKADANVQRWQSEAKRAAALFAGKVIDEQNRDEALNQVRSAEAAYDEAGAKVQSAAAARAEAAAKKEKAEADLAAAKNKLLLAQSDVRRMEAMLAYARITAPFDGVVADRRVHTGHFLQPAAGGTKGDPLFVVVRTDKVRVFLDVPEQDAVLIRDQAEGRVRVQVLNDREFTGKVAGTSWSLEPGQRTMRTEIDLDNPDGLLRPGMYVHAIIAAERGGAWTLPSAAIIVRDGQTFCYRVEDGKAVRTAVKIGSRDGGTVEVLKKQKRSDKPGEKARWEDLVGDERVVVTKPGELTDGQVVRLAGG